MARQPGYRVQLAIRLNAADKDYFCARAEDAGLEPSVAARQIMDLLIQRMRTGKDFVDVLHELKTAWDFPKQSEIDRRIAAAQRALSEFKGAGDERAVLESIEKLHSELSEPVEGGAGDHRAKRTRL